MSHKILFSSRLYSQSNVHGFLLEVYVLLEFLHVVGHCKSLNLDYFVNPVLNVFEPFKKLKGIPGVFVLSQLHVVFWDVRFAAACTSVVEDCWVQHIVD